MQPMTKSEINKTEIQNRWVL